ncbi:hypothetical protein Ae201684_006020 [Aphanomyces euteiches]|uniref:Uncharacterized protein n=1 Tax=Aphanomyces euteiches TaxID=100861 RepID=A0A6G0XDA1_9STRA|nr:hypothetical protein Ae201684_006020 [Aphanomyces euteiches]
MRKLTFLPDSLSLFLLVVIDDRVDRTPKRLQRFAKSKDGTSITQSSLIWNFTRHCMVLSKIGVQNCRRTTPLLLHEIMEERD